jgi:hypothetical protein
MHTKFQQHPFSRTHRVSQRTTQWVGISSPDKADNEGYPFYALYAAQLPNTSPHSDHETAEARKYCGSDAVGDLPLTPHVARRSDPCARAVMKRHPARTHAGRQRCLTAFA